MTVKHDSRPEANRICNLLPSRHDTAKDWGIEQALAANAIAAPPDALPASVDLRAAWWDVGNQENTGSCVGWGSTDGVARYHFVKAGRLAPAEHLSVRLSWMGAKETDIYTTHPTTFMLCGKVWIRGIQTRRSNIQNTPAAHGAHGRTSKRLRDINSQNLLSL